MADDAGFEKDRCLRLTRKVSLGQEVLPAGTSGWVQREPVDGITGMYFPGRGGYEVIDVATDALEVDAEHISEVQRALRRGLPHHWDLGRDGPDRLLELDGMLTRLDGLYADSVEDMEDLEQRAVRAEKALDEALYALLLMKVLLQRAPKARQDLDGVINAALGMMSAAFAPADAADEQREALRDSFDDLTLEEMKAALADVDESDDDDDVESFRFKVGLSLEWAERWWVEGS